MFTSRKGSRILFLTILYLLYPRTQVPISPAGCHRKGILPPVAQIPLSSPSTCSPDWFSAEGVCIVLAGATLLVVREALMGCSLSDAALRQAVQDGDGGNGSEDCLAEQAVLNAVVDLLNADAFG